MIGVMTYCILLVSFSFNIFIPCYIGELLAVEVIAWCFSFFFLIINDLSRWQCKKVGLAAYMVSWYRLPGKKAMCMVIIIAASESSPKLTAGKFVDLSLTTFCSVSRDFQSWRKRSCIEKSIFRSLNHQWCIWIFFALFRLENGNQTMMWIRELFFSVFILHFNLF